MKKILIFLFLSFTLLYGIELQGDPHKGQILYKYLIAPKIKIRGDEFTKKHTKHEWRELFMDNGRRFLEIFEIKNLEIDKEDLKDLEAFMIYYAKDSNIVANCN